jgi:hypothetical protein
LLIRDVLQGSQCQLMPRPRRFGKTLNMNMLKCWFDITAKDQAQLFAGLKILQEAPEILASQGAFPVIFLSLKDWKCGGIEDLHVTLAGRIGLLFSEHAACLRALDEDKQAVTRRLRQKLATPDELKNSLSLLMEALHLHHGSKVVVLIDEYDAPILHAISEGFAPDAIKLLGPWLSAALKNNIHLEKAVLTGILCLAQQSIFSDLIHFTCLSLLDPGGSADKFGFTTNSSAKSPPAATACPISIRRCCKPSSSTTRPNSSASWASSSKASPPTTTPPRPRRSSCTASSSACSCRCASSIASNRISKPAKAAPT